MTIKLLENGEMARDKIIQMSREADAPDWWIGLGTDGEIYGPAVLWLERFAALVAKAKHDETVSACIARLEQGFGAGSAPAGVLRHHFGLTRSDDSETEGA